MTAKTDFLKNIHQTLRERLEGIGFAKRGYIFRKNVNDDFIGDIGLNHDTVRGELILKINPVIGVYSKEVAKILEDLGKKDSSQTSHISIPLGYLTPEASFKMWHFESGIDNEATADDMIRTIQEYGEPWIRGNSTLDRMCRTMLIGKYGWPHWLEFCTPITLYLLDRRDEALELAKKNLAKRTGAGGAYEDDYRKFVDRLEVKITGKP